MKGGTRAYESLVFIQVDRVRDAGGAACADIAGATGQTYVVGPADAGKTVRVVEKATNRFGTATAESTPTTAVA
jgi:hypothetical protein